MAKYTIESKTLSLNGFFSFVLSARCNRTSTFIEDITPIKLSVTWQRNFREKQIADLLKNSTVYVFHFDHTARIKFQSTTMEMIVTGTNSTLKNISTIISPSPYKYFEFRKKDSSYEQS